MKNINGNHVGLRLAILGWMLCTMLSVHAQNVCETIRLDEGWKFSLGNAADTAQPGFRHIIMKPFPDKRLGHLDAEYKSAAGLIKSSWKYEGDKWIWKFTIPKGATASVTLPGETQSHEYQAGSYTIKMNLDK